MDEYTAGINRSSSCIFLSFLQVERFATLDRFLKGGFEFFPGLSPDIDVVVCPKKAGFQLAVRRHPEPVTEPAEFGIVKRADDLDFGAIETVFLPVVHPPGNDHL